MKKVAVLMLCLSACCEQPKPEPPRAKTCEERISETFNTIGTYAPTCFQLGACLKQDAKFEPRPQVIYPDGSYGGRREIPEFYCRVGTQEFSMNEISPAFRGCMAAKATK